MNDKLNYWQEQQKQIEINKTRKLSEEEYNIRDYLSNGARIEFIHEGKKHRGVIETAHATTVLVIFDRSIKTFWLDREEWIKKENIIKVLK